MALYWIVFGFGGSPESPINRTLANLENVGHFPWEQEARIFTQREVPTEKAFFAEDVVLNKGYLSSLGVAKAFKKFLNARENKSVEVDVFAAPQHIGRCVRDLKKVLGEGIQVRPTEILALEEIEWYWPESPTQPWCRSPWHWWPREIILRLLPFSLYEWLDKKASGGGK